MFRISEPSDKDVANFISHQRDLWLTYPAVEPHMLRLLNYNIDHNRIQLGHGEATFRTAIEALKSWRHFDLGWVTIVPRGVKIEVGAIVAVKAHVFGLWSLNACRVVYVFNEARRFGFAYGTLPGHVERGEEHFVVEWLPDNSVWYDILAFSLPQHPLVKLTFPVARLLQKRFARNSLARMKNHVNLDNRVIL